MDFISIIGVILGVFTIVYLSLKGISITIAAPLATLMVIMFNGMDLVSVFLGSELNHYMGALGNYIINFFPVFLLGSILGKLMEDSGATLAIADFILKKFGSNQPYRVMVVIFVISFILTYGGISVFVVMFTIIPLAHSLFKKINISWNLIQIPLWLGIGCLTVTLVPGTPSIHNVIPIQFLNTSLTAAGIPSLLGSLGCAAFGLSYMKYTLNKSLKKGETYSTSNPHLEEKTRKEQLPSFATSMLPLVTLMMTVVIGSTFGSVFIQANIIYIALSAAIILALIFHTKYIPNKKMTLTSGANGSIAAIFATASAVAFGSVIIVAPGFTTFLELILTLPGHPLFSLTVLTSVISGVTGSSSGTLGIVMPNFTSYYLEAGIHPEMIHRVAAIGSNMTTMVPQSGVLITFLSLAKLNYKNGYKESFIVVTIGCLIAVIIVILTGFIFY